MPTFRVRVDDPDMGSAHELTVESATVGSAVFEAAARAILADRLGGGLGWPPCPPAGASEHNDGTFELPREARVRHADDFQIVGAVARWAVVLPGAEG